jgi:hypothetical protein
MSEGMERKTTDAAPNPGSNEAFLRGCTCPVIDNNHGEGYKGLPGCFVYVSGCPVHWPHGTTRGPFISVAPTASIPEERGTEEI